MRRNYDSKELRGHRGSSKEEFSKQPLKSLTKGVFPHKEIVRAKSIQTNVILVNNSEMKRLNKQFLGRNGVTDVLAFPMGEGVGEGVFFLGEVVVNTDQAKKQAREWSISVEEEIARLITHGALHLLGYRDETSENREKMEKVQERIIKKLGIKK